MLTIKEIKQQIIRDPKNWAVYLMDFVDDFRYYKNPAAIQEPFVLTDEHLDGLLASTVEFLCDELEIETIPDWLQEIPACRDPWFVSGIENLKALALAESPVQFRIRKIFVLENFLHRV